MSTVRRELGPYGSHASRVRAPTTAVAAITRLAVLLCQAPLAYAAPVLARSFAFFRRHENLSKSPAAPDLWVYLGTAIALVLLGGAFAGLTIALMGQDEIYLQVIATSGEGTEKKHARRVLQLLKKGKHWVLVTLLLSNVITNETLPIVLDRSLGGGWPAVVTSTVAIVIFGEIAPQSICVRYGLPIGAWMSPFVLALMWLMSPIAWPTAKLLDWLLGQDHGTVYKKAGLKTLVTLHKTLGSTPGERLNEDEVTIISAVLDLKDKAIGTIMTPMSDVFTMSADTILDESMMDIILSQGYSRIPIYAPENPQNFIGMLLVKILITYDPEDGMRVRDFSLATLPETAPDTSCLDIVNFFQEGKSHMVLVSDQPGQDHGALGVVTLEDVIEELIGEEIIDESDVYVDVHKAIRRLAPAPKMKFSKHEMRMVSTDGDGDTATKANESETEEASETTSLLANASRGPSGSRKASLTPSLRDRPIAASRTASGLSKDGGAATRPKPMPQAKTSADMRQHFMHLGPSNVASRPRATKFAAVKIKPGAVSGNAESVRSPLSAAPLLVTSSSGPQNAHTALLLSRANPPGAQSANESDGDGHAMITTVQNEQQTRDGINIESEPRIEAKLDAELESLSTSPKTAAEASALAAHNVVASPGGPASFHSKRSIDQSEKRTTPTSGATSRVSSNSNIGPANRSPTPKRDSENDQQSSGLVQQSAVRTGTITENVVDVGGMRKVVLEPTASSSSTNLAGLEPSETLSSSRKDVGNGVSAGPAEVLGGRKNSVDDTVGEGDKKKKKKRGGKKLRKNPN